MSKSPRTSPVDPLVVAFKNNQLFVQVASLLTLLTGLLLVWRPLLRHSYHHFARYIIPPNVQDVADFTSLAIGLALVYLAYELMQRKRSAWFVTLAASLASLITDVAFDRPDSQSVFVAVVIVVLLMGHKQFVVRPHVTHLRQGVTALIGSVTLALLYGTAGFWLLDKRDFGINFSLTESFENTLRQYSQIGGSGLVAHTRFSHWFLNSLTVVGVATIIYCLYSILRPLRYELRTLPAERVRAHELLQRYGGDIDDYFKLWPEDKSYFFSSDGEAFIAYGVARGVAIAFAGPEGRPESISRVLHEFRAYCLNNGWLVAFIAASDKHKTTFEHLGFQTLAIGADAVIDVDKFLGETVNNKYFRNIVNRYAKGNFSCTRHLPPHSPELIKSLSDVSDDWLKIPGHKQWRFLTGYFSAPYFAHTPLFVVRDETGKALAFVNELPSFKAGEATIDLMRHRRDAPKNIMDYLFIELMRRLHEQQIQNFNLGISPMARQSFAGSFSERLLDYIYLASQRFVSVKGLHQYKAKFKPEWEPRYVYYIGSAPSLPHIGLALAKLTLYEK